RTPSKSTMRASHSDNGGMKTMTDEKKERGWLGTFLARLNGDERKQVLAELNDSDEGKAANRQASSESPETKALRERVERFDAQQAGARNEAAQTFAGEMVIRKAILP